jgi:phosphatidylglycerophosphatase A
MTRLAVLVATVGGAGYFPFAPGTVGSAVGVGLYLATRHLSPAWQFGILGLVIVAGVWASTEAERHFKREDPGHVVIDEVAGQLVTLLMTGAGLSGAVIGFFVFRILDIIKPWPANRLEALHGGVGIMADDLMAGLYGLIIMAGVSYALPWAI